MSLATHVDRKKTAFQQVMGKVEGDPVQAAAIFVKEAHLVYRHADKQGVPTLTLIYNHKSIRDEVNQIIQSRVMRHPTTEADSDPVIATIGRLAPKLMHYDAVFSLIRH